MLVSIDIGNGFTKGHARPGGMERESIFPSVGAIEQGAIRFDGLATSNDLVIEYCDQRVALGDSAYKLGRMQVVEMGRARVGESAYMNLYAGLLSQLAYQSAELTVIASLPVRWYTGDKEAARKALARQMVVRVGGSLRTYDVKAAHIVPEGFGALCSLIMNHSGKIINADLGRSRVGIVDVGTRTTDLLRFDQLELIPVKSDGMDKVGMASVWQLVGELITGEYGRDLEVTELDQAVAVRYFKDGPNEVAIGAFVDSALDALAQTITAKVRSWWDDGREVDAIAVAGGGAHYVFDRLPFANKYLVEDGAMANVRGAYRFGIMKGLEK